MASIFAVLFIKPPQDSVNTSATGDTGQQYLASSGQLVTLGAAFCLNETPRDALQLVESCAMSLVGVALSCDFPSLKRVGVDVTAVKQRITSVCGSSLALGLAAARCYAAYRFLASSDTAKMWTMVSQTVSLILLPTAYTSIWAVANRRIRRASDAAAVSRLSSSPRPASPRTEENTSKTSSRSQ